MDTNAVKVAKCGMDCTACRFAEENDCPGCMYCLSGRKLFEDEECEVGVCCTGKGLSHCGQCGDFPCDMLKEVSFDVHTGDGGNRLLTLKTMRESESGRKRLRLMPPLCGICLGLLMGIIIGAVTDMHIPWILAGLIAGCGTGAIVSVVKIGDTGQMIPAGDTVKAADIPEEEAPPQEKSEHIPKTDRVELFADTLRAAGGESPENKKGKI